MDLTEKPFWRTVVAIAFSFVLYLVITWVAEDFQYSGFPTIILTVLFPIGLLIMSVSFGLDESYNEWVGWVGLALTIIPTLILHITILADKGAWLMLGEATDPNYYYGSFYSGFLFISCLFPAACMGGFSNFMAKGVGYSGFMVAYCIPTGFIPTLIVGWILTRLFQISLMAWLVTSLIIGLVMIAGMFIVRFTVGSPFEA